MELFPTLEIPLGSFFKWIIKYYDKKIKTEVKSDREMIFEIIFLILKNKLISTLLTKMNPLQK
jgi:hypothetical protein